MNHLRTKLLLVLGVLALSACSDPPPTVPDVVGLDEESARKEIGRQGYEVEVSEEYFDDAQLGEVINQRPSAGAQHDSDRPVQITLAAEFLTPTVEGYFVLRGDSDSIVGANGGCEGSRGYNDISERTQVVVQDEAGTILAATALGQGTPSGGDACYFEFTLGSLPHAQFYSFEVSQRGALTYSLRELESNGWRFEASLGSH